MKGSSVVCKATSNLQAHHIRRVSKKADAKSLTDQIILKLDHNQLLVC